MVGRAGLGPFHDENICDLADKVADWFIIQKQRISRTVLFGNVRKAKTDIC